ncbi:MAG: DUF2905 domain-containing protein [Syntrophomonadaceae bacterium]|jgi:hypothetical protein|nr:DUF2905 domain-containing protein [Syntrophomonadaceae bacterium]
MGDWNYFGKLFLIIGIIFLALGAMLLLFTQVFKIGRLPGDIIFQKGNFTFVFPLATSIIISLVLTIIASVFFRR